MKLKNLVQTCYACPSQWDAETEDGKYVYIRYRHGYFRLDIDDKTFYEETIDRNSDGFMTEEEMLGIVEKL